MASPVTMEGKLLFPSEYLAAVEFKGKDVALTIDHVEVAELRMEGGKSANKPIVYFHGTKKKLVLNKTNANTIAGLYGNEVNDWAGKRVTLYPTKVRCGRDTVDAIRVRDRAPQQKQTQQQQQPAPSPQPPQDHDGDLDMADIDQALGQA